MYYIENEKININNLQVDENLFLFINNEAIKKQI